MRKGLITVESAVFLPVAMEGRAPGASAEGSAHPVEIRLANGRSLSVTTAVPAVVVQRLIRVVEGIGGGIWIRFSDQAWGGANPKWARSPKKNLRRLAFLPPGLMFPSEAFPGHGSHVA